MRARVAGRVVPALAYHKVADVPCDARYRCNYTTPSRFAAQMHYLRRAGYSSISFGDYLAHRRGAARLPRKPILITFDDGYRSLLDFAIPTLERFGFRATVFAVAGLVGETNVWDADEVQEPLLSAVELRSLHARGFDVQSHTWSHPHLPTLSREAIQQELAESKAALEAITGGVVNVIAYPWSEHDIDTPRLALKAGYEAGAILRRRTNYDDTPLFELRRIGINDETSLTRFAWDLARLRVRGA